MNKHFAFEKELRDLKMTMKASDHLKTELNSIGKQTAHTRCGKRIIKFQTCVIILLLILCPVTAYASNHAVMIMKQKIAVQELLSDPELEKLYYRLQEEGFTDKEIIQLESLNVNENGQTYGPDCLDAELILCTSDQGEDGYIYRSELEQSTAFQSPEEAVKWSEEFNRNYPNGYTIAVYKSDGETKIGTFTMR